MDEIYYGGRHLKEVDMRKRLQPLTPGAHRRHQAAVARRDAAARASPGAGFNPAEHGKAVEGGPARIVQDGAVGRLYVSGLRSCIEAAGGKLKIVAEFREGEVAIINFSEVGKLRRAP